MLAAVAARLLGRREEGEPSDGGGNESGSRNSSSGANTAAAATAATAADTTAPKTPATGSATAAAPPTPPGAAKYAATLKDVRAAAKRIKGIAKVTPVMTCSSIDAVAGRQLFFKCENLQKGGAFKFRGALNSVMLLLSGGGKGTKGRKAKKEKKGKKKDSSSSSSGDGDDGGGGGGAAEAEAAADVAVVCHSSGNHAAALALAARMRGAKAHIVVPRDAPRCKIEAVRAYGGDLVLCEPTMEAREAACARVAAETGAVFIPPYDYGPVIAGQGTIALELLKQVKRLDAIVVPVSGGGMISGVAVAAKALRPSVRVVAAEPRGSNDAADAAESKRRGERAHDMPKPRTIADGLQARLGDLTWPIVRDLVDEVVVVDDSEIVAAMRLLFERAKVVVEPSGAAGLAAALSEAGREALRGCGRVGVVLSGGNVDFEARGFWEAWSAAA